MEKIKIGTNRNKEKGKLTKYLKITLYLQLQLFKATRKNSKTIILEAGEESCSYLPYI